MADHQFILVLFLVSAAIVGMLFYYIYRSSLHPAGDSQGVRNPLKKRFFFAIVLASVIAILLSITIPKSPYFLFADSSPAKVVYVAAQQYVFLMDYKAIDPENLEVADSIVVPANQPVEFRVTSLDVNHGFALYNERSELITQTQAMPGYVNRLRWMFTEPGTYSILCLEYCGLGHPLMRATFTVN